MEDDIFKPCDRLKIKRKAAGYKTAGEFCQKHGISLRTYSSHESGDRRLTEKAALRYGELLGVSSEWLLTGKVSTKDIPKNNISGYSQGNRALIVEDDIVTQKAIKIMLEDYQCESDVASSGIEAIKKSTSLSYQLILIDLGLPDIDGLSVVESIRKFEHDTNKKKVPIIVLTSHGDDVIEKMSLKLGVEEFIHKPLEMETLENAINKFLTKK